MTGGRDSGRPEDAYGSLFDASGLAINPTYLPQTYSTGHAVDIVVDDTSGCQRLQELQSSHQRVPKAIPLYRRFTNLEYYNAVPYRASS